MPAWPRLQPLVEPLLALPPGQLDCWGLVAVLLEQGFGLDLVQDQEGFGREVVEIWFETDPRPPLTLVQPWDCVLMAITGPVADHCGLVMEGTQLVHTRAKQGVRVEPLTRFMPHLLQIVRLRRLC